MTTPTYAELTSEQDVNIRSALRAALPAGPDVTFDEKSIMRRGDELYVMVKPLTYPEAMFDFMQRLASAEFQLRDMGLKVRLSPDVRQRMLVVAKTSGDGPIAYLSTDGTEYEDLARLLGTSEEALAPVFVDGYAYDTDDELAEAVKAAKGDYPKADFSRVTG